MSTPKLSPDGDDSRDEKTSDDESSGEFPESMVVGAVTSIGDPRISRSDALSEDLRLAERKIAAEIDPGARAMVVACAVGVLLLSLVLPHAGAARGFDVLFYDAVAQRERIGMPSRVFEWFVLIFAVGFSVAALVTRRWTLAWIAAAGTAISTVFGVFAIWHRQTSGLAAIDGAGPSIGLILATITAVVLTFHWVRVVWSRTEQQLEAELQRREAALAAEARYQQWLGGPSS